MEPFWQNKSLAELSRQEWESLCDGCGKCCLHKLEDEDTGDLHFTNVACALLDPLSCRCRDYANRFRKVPDCIQLRPENIHDFGWLPQTCAYRLLAEGKDLAAWHPLRSGTPDSVHRAGISVCGWTVSERDVDDLEQHIINRSL